MCSCVPPIPHPSIIDCVDRSSISVCYFFSPALFTDINQQLIHQKDLFFFVCVCVIFSFSQFFCCCCYSFGRWTDGDWTVVWHGDINARGSDYTTPSRLDWKPFLLFSSSSFYFLFSSNQHLPWQWEKREKRPIRQLCMFVPNGSIDGVLVYKKQQHNNNRKG